MSSPTVMRMLADHLLDSPAETWSSLLQLKEAPVSLILERLRSGGVAAIVRPRRGEPIAVKLADDAADPSTLEEPLVTLDPRSDDSLPGTPCVLDPTRLLRRLDPLVEEILAVRLVAYRPERRAVFRVDALGASGSPQSFFIKCHRKKTFARMTRLLEHLPPGREHLHLCRPVLLLREEAAMVTRRAPGESLHQTLSSREVCARTLAGCVRLLADDDVEELPLHTFEDERAATLNMLRRGGEVMPELQELVDKVRSLPLPHETHRGIVHRDLHDKQIFIDGDDVYLIDLDSVRCGDPLVDVVNLAEHLALRSLQLPLARDRIQKLRADFLTSIGFDREDYRVRFLVGLTSSRLAGVYALRPLELGLARRLLDRARGKLKALTENVRAGA